MNILIIYGSSTGNTERLAYYIMEKLNGKYTVEIEDSMNLEDDSVLQGNIDLYLFCVSTWGIEPAEIQEDFEQFWQNVDKSIFNNKKCIVIGMGDDYYPHFAISKDLIEKDLLNNNAILAHKGLKIQDPWEEEKKEINTLINSLL